MDPLLSGEQVLARAREASLPEVWRQRVGVAGILTARAFSPARFAPALGIEELIVRRHDPKIGGAVCLVSGDRVAFRRILGGEPGRWRLRGDVAPFDDIWRGDIVGCVEPRLIDHAMALDPVRLTRANWYAALGAAHALAARKRFLHFGIRRQEPSRFVTRILDPGEWSLLRIFWLEAQGEALPELAQERQRVVGLFDGRVLIGANIHLRFGDTSYSAYTLVHRRYRQHGGGRRMIAHAVEDARENGVKVVYVHINARNVPSNLAYARVGFQPVRWWRDAADPLLAAERQWRVHELAL